MIKLTVHLDSVPIGTIWINKDGSIGYESSLTGLSWENDSIEDAVEHLASVHAACEYTINKLKKEGPLS